MSAATDFMPDRRVTFRKIIHKKTLTISFDLSELCVINQNNPGSRNNALLQRF